LSDAQAIAERFCHAQSAQSIGPHGGGVASASFTFASHFNAIYSFFNGMLDLTTAQQQQLQLQLQ